MSLFVSTSWSESNKKNLKEKIKEFEANGIKNIELSGGTRHYDGLQNDLISLKEKYDINFIIHNYFPPPKEDFVLNIASEDKENLERSIEFVKKSINLANKLDSSLYTLHAGYAKKLNVSEEGYFEPTSGSIDWIKTYQIFYNSIDELLNYAEKKDIKLGIENLFPFNKKENYSIMCTKEEIDEMLSRYNDNEYLGLLIDLGHLNIAAHYMGFDKNQFIEYLVNNYREKIFEFHISENNGKEDAHLPIKKEGWQLKTIKKHGLFDIPVVIEGKNISFNLIKQVSDIIERR